MSGADFIEYDLSGLDLLFSWTLIMPLKYIRSKVTADNVLSTAIATTAITQELATLLQFPPVSAAASLLQKIFQTIQTIQTNRDDCYHLARRCLSLLLDIRDQMDGRWDDAPQSLIKALKKFEQTLESINEYMRNEAAIKWRSRLLRKNAIENALVQYNSALDDAARSFQIATLVNIHYAVGDRSTSSKPTLAITLPETCVTDVERLTSSPALKKSTANQIHCTSEDGVDLTRNALSSEACVAVSESPSYHSVISSVVPATVPKADTAFLNNHGFRRYHQSELIIQGRSRIKEGWWAGAMDVQAGGQRSLAKRYEGSAATKRWLRDVKILQNVFHPNLPQMIGYSSEETPTPFILLANVQTRLPQALVLDAIKNASLAACANVLVRLYRDTLDAALYLQRQLNLSDSKIQDYVENASFCIDAAHNLVMGLPPPEVDALQSYRNFGLAHSIREIYIKLLPNRGYAKEPYDPMDATTSVEMQQKVNHLALLAGAILPSSTDVAIASSRLQRILGDEDEQQYIDSLHLTLRQIRIAALEANTHQQTWRQNTVPAYKYAVGDVGYIPSGKGFESFSVLCNILLEDRTSIETAKEATGGQSSWDGGFGSTELQPFDLPDDVKGWTIVVPAGTKQNLQIVHEAFITVPSRAWRYLLEHGKDLAKSHDVKAEDLILVTRVGVDQRFTVQDLRTMHFHHNPHTSRFSVSGSNHQHYQQAGLGLPGQFSHYQHHTHAFPNQPMAPSLFFLFTSMDKAYEPWWSETPAYSPPLQGANRPEFRAKAFANLERTFGFLNYVQLHAEDFAD
ncbi:hypothetical protein AcW1_002181 [Taiwanofungus camphoratus]|nr:hypothetical protein AcW1_002181 [Antrodia cinnamomea]KAI0946141.1 hypothetical protein AcV7_010191 [Antrodia cinnamomea]